MEPAPIHHIPPRDAESALQRAAADADWLSSLRGAYRGRHDVLDALWWAAHPLTMAPGGSTDPADGLRDLQSAVFSRTAAQTPVIEFADPDSGDPLRMREAEHRLWERQRLLAEDARLLNDAWLTVTTAATAPAARAALNAVPGEVEAPPYVEASAHPYRAPEPGRDSAPVAPPEPPDRVEPDSAPRRKLLFPALAGVGLLAALLVVPTLTGLDAGAESEPTPAATTPATTPHARMDIVTLMSDGNVTDPQAVLARPATETDLPRVQPGEPFEAESFRRLPDLVGFLELYLARAQADTICLVVVRNDGASQGSCVSSADFARQGIELGSSGDRYQVGPDVTILSESFSLLANGDFHYEARARAPRVMPDRDTVFPGAEEQFLGS